MKKHVPNFFSLLNMASGSIGVIMASKGQLRGAALCIGVGALLDFLDGWLARLLNKPSLLGKQLDSLADLITFGFLPAFIMYALIGQYTASPYFPFIALLLLLFSALRLARFNIDTRQKNVFIGLPTPAHACFMGTLPYIITGNHYPWLTAWLTHAYTLIAIVLLFSWLLVANLTLMAFKFTTYAWYPNRFNYGFLLTAACLTLCFHAEGIALSLLLYLLLSILRQKSLRKS